MNITVDIGNSLIKIGIFENDALIEVLRTEKEEEALKAILRKSPKKIIVSSVRKDSQAFIQPLSTNITAIFLDNNTPLPFKNAYQTPLTLGSDRISAIAGAFALYPYTNCLVIDMGTCIKCDVIDQTNTYRGGSISPGIEMRLKALNHYTGRLPYIPTEDIDFLQGRNTKESILSGVINGALFEMEGFTKAYSKIFPQLNVIITGGDSYSFESRIKEHIFVIPDLVLLGLNKILQYNLSITSA